MRRATSSANLKSVNVSPSILMPCVRSAFLNISSIAVVKSFGEMMVKSSKSNPVKTLYMVEKTNGNSMDENVERMMVIYLGALDLMNQVSLTQ